MANGDPLPAWLTFAAATRAFSGTPPRDFNGSISVKVTASDGTDSANDVFTLTINPVNDDPVAGDDSVSADQDTPVDYVVADLLANDGDVDGDGVALSLPSGTTAQGGTVSLSGGLVTYTPVAGFSGTDSFTYAVSDGKGGTDTAVVTATVNAAVGNNVIMGTPNGDVLDGTNGVDEIYGLGGADTINGRGADDITDGDNGADRIDGGAGADTMRGGAGDDFYVVDVVGDLVVELASQGTDTVRAYLDYVLPDNVEKLYMRGVASSGTGTSSTTRYRPHARLAGS